MTEAKKLLRVFVADVDTPIGRSVSRHLSHTTIGSLLPQPDVEADGEDTTLAEKSEEGKNEDALHTAEETKTTPVAPKQMQKVPTYTVWGSLSEHPADEQLQKPKTATKPKSAQSSWSSLVEASEAARRKAMLAKVDLKIAEPGVKPDWVEQSIDASERHLLKQSLADADVVIYDIMQNLEEAQFALQFLQETAKTGTHSAFNSAANFGVSQSLNMAASAAPGLSSASSSIYGNVPASALISSGQATKKKVFIAVSHLLTWARTLPLSKAYPDEEATEEEEMAVLESEYKRRKCHPVYKNQLAFERELIKAQNDGLDCYVINSGVRYGPGTHCLEQLLRVFSSIMLTMMHFN